MIEKRYLFAFVLLFCTGWSYGQQDSCHMVFHGHVVDAKSHEGIPGAIVFIKKLNKNVSTDSTGQFTFTDFCPGKYTFVCEYISYTKYEDSIQIDKYSHPTIALKPMSIGLNVVVIRGERKKEELSTVTQSKLDGAELDKTRGQSLGESLKDISGLNAIQTGPGVSKPVIHGLHSNRILILNNGVRQEGQQWGQDHAPEIDPFTASEISIIKGPASVRYGSDAIGGVVLLQPKKLPENPGINGELNLVGASNNTMGAVSGMLEGAFGKKLTGLSWRVQGTYRRAGNSKTPNYYLDNTGFQENDFSSALAYDKDNYGAEIYYSRFSSQIGILSASHIGNANDLYQAINSPQPIEKSVFAYTIDRPYQTVLHNLYKVSSYLRLPSVGKIEAIYALQEDIRQEYTPDISYNDSIAALNLPELSFKIISHTIDLCWHHHEFNLFSGSIGISGKTQGNVYRGTDYFSVIPNFRNYGSGVFAIEKWTKNKLTIEGGLRYDYLWLQVYMYNINQQYVSPLHQYSNITSSLGAVYKFTNHLSLNANYGSAWRAPGPNELYGKGVHVSAASFEQGDTALKVEQAYNFSGSLKYQKEKFSVELGLYDNIINNFIFLKPDAKPIVLISGAYPAFHYTQANVVFRGVDIDLKYYITKQLILNSKTTLVKAFNYSINDYLIFTPADRFQNSLKYEFKPLGKFNQCYISISNLYVAHQNRVPLNSDFTTPPAAYILFNAEVGTFISVKKRQFEIGFSANNITNVAYRDYLNRLRYFSDEIGRNFVLRLKIPLFPDKQL